MSSSRRVAVMLRIDLPYADHQGVFSGVNSYAQQAGWTLAFDPRVGRGVAARIDRPERYDGIVGRVGRLGPEGLPRVRELGIPMVNTMYAAATEDLHGVYIDAEACGRLAAEHLLDRGFHRTAFMGIEGIAMSERSGLAFCRTGNERGGTCVHTEFGSGLHGDAEFWLGAGRHFEAVLDQLTPPVGVFTVMPWVGRMMMNLSANRGWRVPQDVAIVCMDHVRSALELPPQMTWVNSNHERVGYEAAAMLDRLMNEEALSSTQIIVPPGGIIARQSTDYVAVEDDVVAEAIRYISEHLREKLTLIRVAEAVAVSPRTLQRRFKSALGRSIVDEVRRLRLEIAKRLLRSPHAQVRHVAREAGFSSYITMNHVFHEELGMSPSAYRDQVVTKPPVAGGASG